MLRHRTTFGPASKIMSLGTECAGEQDKFWEFHDARIRNGSSSVAGQISLAGDLGLNVSQFTACMEEERYQTFLAEDRAAAQTYGVFNPARLHHLEWWRVDQEDRLAECRATFGDNRRIPELGSLSPPEALPNSGD